MAHGRVAADVVHIAVARVACPGAQERVGRILHVDEVPQLRPVTVDLDLAALDRCADEPPDEALAVVLHQLARTVDIGQAQRAGADAEDVVVEDVIVLAGRLVDAVDVGGPHEVRLGDRERVGLPIYLARAGEHDLHARVVAAAGLEERQLAAAVDLEIRVGIPHAVDVAHLSGQVEDHRPVAHEVVHRALLADVCHVHPHPRLDAANVEEIAAVVRDHRVDQQDLRPEVGQLAREVAADEAQAPGDHHLAAAVEGSVISHVRCWPRAGLSGPRRPLRAGVRAPPAPPRGERTRTTTTS